MNVEGLRRYFRNLSEILETGKASKGILDDLDAIERGLLPFENMPLKSFADFLVKANTYDPAAVIGKPLGRGSTTRTPKASLDVGGIAATVKHLFDTAKNPDVTIESIDEGLQVLDPLTKPNLITVARAINAESGLNTKTKAQVLTIIKHAVRDMWGSARRIKQ